MRIYCFTSKLNFKTAGGSVEEFDLIVRTMQEMGHEVVAVTVFSEQNDIPAPLPYRLLEERIARRDLVGIGRGIFELLRKYERDADFFYIDGHLFLYGAGAYRRLGGTVPVAAHFNRELGCWPPDRSEIIGRNESVFRKAKRGVRWLVERTAGMHLARAIDVCSFISPQYKRMYERFGLRSRRSMILGDPFDHEALMRTAGVTEQSYRERVGHPGPFRVFFSSRMVAGKGFDLILAGFARVQDKAGFSVVFGGGGPEEASIRKMADELGVAAYVEFTGWMTKERLLKEYGRADAFIQLGWRPEGTSISLLNALAFGVPCIVPSDSGMAWQAGDAAITVRNGDHEAVAHALETLRRDRELCVRLSVACYERLSDKRMAHRKVIGALLALMQQTCG